MESASLLKAIATWRKQLVADLLPDCSQSDQLSLHQIAQEIISQAITLQICHDRHISPNIISPNIISLNIESMQFHSALHEKMLPLAMQYLCALKHSYQISALPIELLGQIQEQFWATHQSIDRKAQGVYYTPVAVVDYMINHTVGTLLQNKTVAELSNNIVPLRILDPACGSGVFLLRAYQFLLNWYRTQYLANLNQYQQKLCLNHQGDWQLTIAEKQQILLRHIFGLDINPQSIQVAKRSLLLQMLADSVEKNHQVQNCSDSLYNPSFLNANLQCGNALVDLDFYDQHEPIQFTLEETNQLQAFCWQNSFSTIVQSGGFEVVIGNPPWVFTRNVAFGDRLKTYYQTKYLNRLEPSQRSKAKQTGKVNLFVLFLLKFVELMHKQGQIGIVVPNTLLRATGYTTARKYILDRCSIEQIVDLGHETFSGITASSIVLILSKNLDNATVKLVSDPVTKNAPKLLNKTSFLNNKDYIFSIFLNQSQHDLFQKLISRSIPLTSLTIEMIEGIVCRKDQIEQRFRRSMPEQNVQQQNVQQQNIQQPDRYQKLLEGKDISRYCITFREKYILFDRKQLHRPRPDYVWSAKEKIILRRIGGGEFALVGALDTEHYYAFASTNNILLSHTHCYNIRYVLALLNSRLLNYYYIQNFTNRSRLTVNISKTSLEQLPIRSIDFDCPNDVMQHDRLVEQVDHLQALHQQLCLVESFSEQQALRQNIEAIDQQIDQWVYQLYDLTEAEIALVTDSSNHDRHNKNTCR